VKEQCVVITGCSRGIGLALCQHYVEQDAKVFAICRHPSSALKALAVDIISDCDLTEAETFQKIGKALSEEQIDLLINNAGILTDEQLGSISYAAIEKQFQVNAIAPLRLTEQLLPQLNSGSKVVMITSRMGSIADNTSGGRYGYRMSKAALNIAAVSLAHDLSDQSRPLGVVHPGLVGTDMIGGHGDITPDEAARRLAERIAELNLDNSGVFKHANGSLLPW